MKNGREKTVLGSPITECHRASILCTAITNRHPNVHTNNAPNRHANAYEHAYNYTYEHSNAHTYAHINGDEHTNGHTISHADGNGNANTVTDIHTNPQADANTNQHRGATLAYTHHILLHDQWERRHRNHYTGTTASC